MVIITATIANIATITVVVFISVYLPVDSGIFPREQVASINLRSLGFNYNLCSSKQCCFLRKLYELPQPVLQSF